jgi:hypothetical protein
LVLLPTVAVTSVVAVMGLREWSVAVNTIDLRNDYNTIAVQLAADTARPDSLTGTQACSHLYAGSGLFPDLRGADAGAAGHLASLAATGIASDDVVMQKLGKGSVDSLNLRELQRGGAGIANLLRYCAAR